MRINPLLGVIVAALCAGCSIEWMSLDNKGNSARTSSTASATPATSGTPMVPATPAQSTAVAPAAPAPASLPAIDSNAFSFVGYTIRLPKRFEQAEIPPGGPPNVSLAAWRGVEDGNYTSGVTAVSIKDPKEVAKSTSNIRQTLVDFLAGTTNRLGIKIGTRGPTQTLNANGIKVSYFEWSGVSPQVSSDGAVYGFVDGGRVVCIMHIAYGEGARQATNEITQLVASVKRE